MLEIKPDFELANHEEAHNEGGTATKTKKVRGTAARKPKLAKKPEITINFTETIPKKRAPRRKKEVVQAPIIETPVEMPVLEEATPAVEMEMPEPAIESVPIETITPEPAPEETATEPEVENTEPQIETVRETLKNLTVEAEIPKEIEHEDAWDVTTTLQQDRPVGQKKKHFGGFIGQIIDIWNQEKKRFFGEK